MFSSGRFFFLLKTMHLVSSLPGSIDSLLSTNHSQIYWNYFHNVVMLIENASVVYIQVWMVIWQVSWNIIFIYIYIYTKRKQFCTWGKNETMLFYLKNPWTSSSLIKFHNLKSQKPFEDRLRLYQCFPLSVPFKIIPFNEDTHVSLQWFALSMIGKCLRINFFQCIPVFGHKQIFLSPLILKTIEDSSLVLNFNHKSLFKQRFHFCSLVFWRKRIKVYRQIYHISKTNRYNWSTIV